MGQAASAARSDAFLVEESLAQAREVCIPGFEDYSASLYAAGGHQPDEGDSQRATSFEALLAACTKRLEKRLREQGQLRCEQQDIKAGSSDGCSSDNNGSSSSSSSSSPEDDATLRAHRRRDAVRRLAMDLQQGCGRVYISPPKNIKTLQP